jgi:DNA-binding IclR family transcriptional regulator
MSAEAERSQANVASPPTERAIAIVELLVGTDTPMKISRIAELLGITRSTCTAILDTLEELQWVERGADLTFQPGPGLIPVANAVRARLPILQRCEPLMRDLVKVLEVESITLNRVDSDHLTLVAKTNRQPGFDAPPSFRLPMFPPFGAAIAAFWSEPERERWLDQTADAPTRDHLRRFLTDVRSTGVGAWHLDRAGRFLQDALAVSASVAPTRGLHRGAASGDHQIAALSLVLGTAAYTAPDFDPAKQPYAISYISGTIFDEFDQPCYSLEAHVLRHDVSHDELMTLFAGVREAADRVTVLCGGHPERFHWAAPGG